MNNLELLHAAYTKHQFSPHFHEGHVIGVIEKGQLGFDYRGEKLVASEGQINLADPGEVHNGFAVSEKGWQYRMFYLACGQLGAILSDLCGNPSPLPFFKKGVIQDRVLAGEIHRLHRDFENTHISLLEKESRFFTLISRVVSRHAPGAMAWPKPGKEQKTVERIKEYINDGFDTPITLDNLSVVAQMSKYYLLRIFSAHTGLTPHAYLTFVRASKARQMMEQKICLADIALLTGFFDQSHLNRVFKKVFGITPGQYSKAVSGI